MACDSGQLFVNRAVKEAVISEATPTTELLARLPLPKDRLPVVVYDFQDQTGQFRPNDSFAEYSSAVTKGGLAVLVKALLDTSQGQWFLVAERGSLENLLRERQIIRAMRQDYLGADGQKLPDLPPMIYGGLMLEGGIIFYDSNVLTGGAAAGYFGISGSTQYRRDVVSVYLRAVNIQDGQVLLSVNSSKTLFSYSVSGGLVRYLSFSKLLEAEAGFSANEPTQLAVRQAIEAAVYSLIMEGAEKGLWTFQDSRAGEAALSEYRRRRDLSSSGVGHDTEPDQARAVAKAQQSEKSGGLAHSVRSVPLPQSKAGRAMPSLNQP